MPRMRCDLSTGLADISYLKDRLNIALQIAEGMEFLHGKGIVHRDIKTHNILLDEQGQVKIADMGLCKAEGFVGDTVCGTPLYMPPEITLGFDYDKAVDVYAFGVLLWFICDGTGELPTQLVLGMIAVPVIVRVLVVRPERLQKFDDDCWKLMNKCWKTDPRQRPSFSEIKTQLQDIVRRIDPQKK
ncbi:dual serine/threonine and tyrosine protein kinase-like [Saccoglossus kowalevskii]